MASTGITAFVEANSLELLAFFLALSAFFTAWANHLLGIYNDPPAGADLLQSKIQQSHATCWQMACGSNFFFLWSAVGLFAWTWFTLRAAGAALAAVIGLLYLMGSIYPWLVAAPTRFERSHELEWWRRLWLGSPLGGVVWFMVPLMRKFAFLVKGPRTG